MNDTHLSNIAQELGNDRFQFQPAQFNVVIPFELHHSQPTDSEHSQDLNPSAFKDDSSTMVESFDVDFSISSKCLSSSGSTDTKSSYSHSSFEEKICSVDILSVKDPVFWMKAMLDGLVDEIKINRQSDRFEERRSQPTLTPFAAAPTGQLSDHHESESRLGKRPRTDATQRHSGAIGLTNTKQSSSQSSIRIISTILHWMDMFQDDERIQLTCLQPLPIMLEEPSTRYHAQIDGLALVVFYNMTAFPNNPMLQLTAFHTLVVLLRPLGAIEGSMLKRKMTMSDHEINKSDVPIGNGDAHVNGHVSRCMMSIWSYSGDTGETGVNRGNSNNSSSSSDGSSNECNNANVNNFSSSQARININQVDRRKSATSHVNNKNSNFQTWNDIINTSNSENSSVLTINSSTHELPFRWEEHGVRVMLDSLRRYSHDRCLQAMGCWAMVNAALYPPLKKSLLRLGAVYAVTNAMMLHPNAETVQFRGLFALINLVIPDEHGSSIQSHVYQIARLTIVAMKNFHTNKSILNRGCLVLRNLSLTRAHVTMLARTPGCVDMLLHCRQVCPHDVLVERSARTIMILIQRIKDKEKLNSGSELFTSANNGGRESASNNGAAGNDSLSDQNSKS